MNWRRRPDPPVIQFAPGQRPRPRRSFVTRALATMVLISPAIIVILLAVAVSCVMSCVPHS